MAEDRGRYRTGFDGLLTLCLSPWAEANLHAPPSAIATMREGFAKIDATARAMLRRDVTLVAGTPALVCALSLAVREAVSTPKQRATLILRVYHELPHEEIARTLGSTVGAVKANFFHALGNLRRLMTP